MKTRLRIFMMVFFLFSQTANANEIYRSEQSDAMQAFIVPVGITVCFQILIHRLPQRFEPWKGPLQIGFSLFLSNFFWPE